MTRIASWFGVNQRWSKPFLVPIAVFGTMPEAFIAAYGWSSPLGAAELGSLVLTGDILQMAGVSLLPEPRSMLAESPPPEHATSANSAKKMTLSERAIWQTGVGRFWICMRPV